MSVRRRRAASNLGARGTQRRCPSLGSDAVALGTSAALPGPHGSYPCMIWYIRSLTRSWRFSPSAVRSCPRHSEVEPSGLRPEHLDGRVLAADAPEDIRPEGAKRFFVRDPVDLVRGQAMELLLARDPLEVGREYGRRSTGSRSFCGTSATLIEKHCWKWPEGRRGVALASRRPSSRRRPAPIPPGNDSARDQKLVISGGEEVEAGGIEPAIGDAA
jgi:hypothetical protein